MKECSEQRNTLVYDVLFYAGYDVLFFTYLLTIVRNPGYEAVPSGEKQPGL